MISPVLIDGVVSAAKEAKKITVAQPKMRHYLDFSGVTYLKSNIEEATHATGMNIVNETSLRNMCVNIMQRLDCKGMLITRGEQGMTVFDREQITNFPPIYGRRNFFSKVGVRDAMTGVFALGIAAGGNHNRGSVPQQHRRAAKVGQGEECLAHHFGLPVRFRRGG